MSVAEPTPAPPEETPQAAGPSAGLLPAEVQEEIDRLCGGVADGLRGGLEQFAQASRERSARAVAAARTGGLELLAEAIRRIRAEKSVTAAATALIDASVLFCSRAVLLINEGEKMSGFHAAGSGARPDGDALQRLTFKISSASALARTVVTSAAVAATGSAANLSAELAAAFQYNESDRVCAYPLRVRDKVLAVVLVDETGKTPIEPAAVEALVTTAEAWIEAIGIRPKITPAA